MNSITFFTRAEILMLNTLISLMSGINRLRVYSQTGPLLSIRLSPTIRARVLPSKWISKPKIPSIRWEGIYQALLPLLIWALLGLAAGFLIGLIKPG